MDSFAVSVSSGITISEMHVKHAFLIAAFFGFFQGVMPLIGWFAGSGIKSFISDWDHWAAFAVLLILGLKMIYDAYCKKDSEDEKEYDSLNIYLLFCLALATSIDALAVGFTLSFIDVGIILPVIIIAVVTFLMSFAGTYIGSIFGHLFEKKIEVLAGLMLIGIGIKILL